MTTAAEKGNDFDPKKQGQPQGSKADTSWCGPDLSAL